MTPAKGGDDDDDDDDNFDDGDERALCIQAAPPRFGAAAPQTPPGKPQTPGKGRESQKGCGRGTPAKGDGKGTPAKGDGLRSPSISSEPFQYWRGSISPWDLRGLKKSYLYDTCAR